MHPKQQESPTSTLAAAPELTEARLEIARMAARGADDHLSRRGAALQQPLLSAADKAAEPPQPPFRATRGRRTPAHPALEQQRAAPCSVGKR